ncbi:chorismate mutase [Ascodesmis nigricans]|uniref:Chorismate mutase n=1 Tax=Ascodesmis nigricans TaxID=341454 RepID=A0A4S2MQT0_9PEZI|nr:chorismate mutase [Ascodesmis nigricans]
MAEVRAEIDRLDREIVALLGQRMRYIEAAARIKPTRCAVRDEWRKNDVIDKAAAKAREVNFPERLVRDVYEVLVEGSIAHEFVKWDRRRSGEE